MRGCGWLGGVRSAGKAGCGPGSCASWTEYTSGHASCHYSYPTVGLPAILLPLQHMHAHTRSHLAEQVAGTLHLLAAVASHKLGWGRGAQEERVGRGGVGVMVCRAGCGITDGVQAASAALFGKPAHRCCDRGLGAAPA